MSDYSLSSRNDVKPLPGALCRRFDCGGTVLAGQSVYVAADGDVEAADAVTFAHTNAIGIAVSGNDGGTSFASGDRVDVCMLGPLAGFSSMKEGTFAYQSATVGAVADGSPGSGNYVWVIGVPISETILFINPWTYDITQQSS